MSLRAYDACLPALSIPVCGRPFPLLTWLRQPRRRRGGWKARWGRREGRGALKRRRWAHCGLRGDCDSGTALRLAHFRRKAIPGVYPIINLSCRILGRNSSLAGYLSKSLTLLSIFVTRLGGGKSSCIRLTVVFLLTPGFFRNSIRYTD